MATFEHIVNVLTDSNMNCIGKASDVLNKKGGKQ
jgi:hypothetical protein